MDTRSLTFKSRNLGDNVTLMLCFTPPTPELFVKQFPLAWKITTLAATGNSVFDVTWTANLGFSASQIGGGGLVTAGNYTPIHVGETTTLQLNNSVYPPVYHFTNPTARPGITTVQAVNGINGPTSIGLGFITDINTDREEMQNAIVYPSVGSGLAVTGEFTPILSAYIAMDYRETQMLKADIQSVTPIWSENLISLGPHTTIVVKKNAAGGYNGVVMSLAEAHDSELPMWKSIDAGLLAGKRAFNATLSFSSIDAVPRGLKAIANQLLSNGYSVKLTVKDGDTDARISLGLPFGTSCNQAEKEVAGIVESYGFPARAAIKERSGELSVYLAGSFSYWADINPASPEWYTGGKRSGGDGASHGGRVANGVPDDVFNGVGNLRIGNLTDYTSSNGNLTPGRNENGNPPYSPALRGSDAASASTATGYGKTRTLGRKVSTMSLATSSIA